MYSNPSFNRYIFRLSKGFIYPEVENAFNPLIKDMLNISLLEYMNSTISNTMIPGFTNESVTQFDPAKKNTKDFPTSLSSRYDRDKTISLTFKLKTNFLNWFILKKQNEVFIDQRHKLPNQDKVFLPPVFLDILDRFGNSIISVQYSQIFMESLDPLNFSQGDNGIGSKTFDMKLKYNNYKIIINNKIQSNYDQKDQNYDQHIY